MNKFRRLFSKRSGFTLVEIIVAFAVFAIMAAMIMQILNMVTLQRESNYHFSEEIDQQELYLITHNKAEYNDSNANDGTLSLNFDDVSVDIGYQMHGANDSGEVNGLAYFVTKPNTATPSTPGTPVTPPTNPDDKDKTGAQTDRMDARITGTKGFEYISVNKVVKVKEIKDKSGKILQTVYAFELCANAGSNMNRDDIPYANYRLYFNDTNGNPYRIVSANYLNVVSFNNADDVNNLGSEAKAAITLDTGAISSSPHDTNKYTVSLTGANGIRVGSPFSPPVYVNTVEKYNCSQCGDEFPNQYSGYNQCRESKVNGWDPCNSHLVKYVDPNAPYSGNGVQFIKDNTTKIEITFAGAPTISLDSFGKNGKQQTDGSYQYKADSKITDDISTGPNIYGAYPKAE